VKVGELPGGEAAQGIVFAADNKTILVQFNVEKELAVYQVRDGGLVDTEARIKLDAGPVSIRTMPRWCSRIDARMKIVSQRVV
jgi:hypothetical protein